MTDRKKYTKRLVMVSVIYGALYLPTDEIKTFTSKINPDTVCGFNGHLMLWMFKSGYPNVFDNEIYLI